MARKGTRKGKIRKAKDRKVQPVSVWAKTPEQTRRAQELTVRNAGVHKTENAKRTRSDKKRKAIQESCYQ